MSPGEHEAMLRLCAIRQWIDHACAGEVSIAHTIEAVAALVRSAETQLGEAA